MPLGPWQYRWGDSPRDDDGRLRWLDEPWQAAGWDSLQALGYPPGREAHTNLWLRTRLPELPERDPALKTGLVLTHVEVYVDDRRVHRFGDVSPDGPVGPEPAAWHLVPLPHDAGGRLLSLRIRSRYSQIGTQAPIEIGARAALLTRTVRRDALRLVAAGAILVLGLVALAIGVFGALRRTVLPFGAYCLGIGAYSLFYTEIKDMLWPGSLAWVAVWMLAVPFTPVGLLLLIAELFGAGRWQVLRRLWQAHLGLGCTLWAFMLGLGVLSPHTLGGGTVEYTLLALCRLLIVVGVFAMLGVVLTAARRGDRDARLVLIGVAVVAAATLREVLAAFGAIHHEYDSLVHWSVLVLIVTLGLVIQRRHAQRLQRYAREVAERAQERALLLRDLHDGVGSIATNIGMLAETSRDGASAERMRERLQEISSLSRDGMDEIRAIMQGVDAEDANWDALAAEVRGLVTRLVDPHGTRRELDLHLDPTHPAPSVAMCRGVLKILREALTNAVKHGARSVRVSLRNGGERLELVVDSEGPDTRAGTAHGVGLGRGLDNMRERAEQLGGAVELIPREAGFTVRLHVPQVPAEPCKRSDPGRDS
jgi:signal transduction histidine kinase